MTAEQFDKWKPGNIAEYAQEHVKAGKWTAAEAPLLAQNEFEHLLPQGLSTPGHRFFSIVRHADRKPVGMLWIEVVSVPKPESFIFNIEIFKPFRRRGYAFQAMTLLEEEARQLGLESIRLHVFGHNPSARSLYEKLGYVVTNIQMRKGLAPASRGTR
jgi:ribosomal protein S18 acetylase RimI-like enzyme